MHLSTVSLFLALSPLVNWAVADPAGGAPIEVLVQAGPFGTAYHDATFDDRELGPFNAFTETVIHCRSGDRLDFISMAWLDGARQVTEMHHGNPDGGKHNIVTRSLKSSDDIESMTAHVCTGSRNRGKVCGILFTIKGQASFACGVLNPGGKQSTTFFSDAKKFWALTGSTQNGGKTLTSIGWLVSQPQ